MTQNDPVDFDFNQIRKGNKTAFKRLFEHYYKRLVNYAFRIVREETISEEIVQEVFIYFWEKKENITITSSLSSYLFSAVKNKCINYIKLELPKSQATMDISDTNLSVDSTESGEDLTVLRKKIETAITQLPPKCRNIFLLSRSAGLTYEEISEELGLSIKTIENQMSIALKKLRVMLESELKRK